MQCRFIANKLSLNIEKTCFTIFSPQRKVDLNPPLNLVISNQRILQVESCKYLGVIIDAKLSWKPHIEYVYKKLVRYVGIFYKVRRFLPLACLRNLYYAFVHPHIVFGIETYANTYETYLNMLVKLNNNLIRILFMKKISTPIC